jgi:D-alanyl-D-alanine carboxypeptidase (penicillin-binding protein 5/6)
MALDNTSFRNACGHDERGHYSSTYDLMVLANVALHQPAFAELVAIPDMTIHTVSGKRSFYLRNKNRLIGNYSGAKGVKTGTTPKAGQCLIALAQRGDTRVLLVMMRSRNRWRWAPAILDFVFAKESPIKEEDDMNDEEEEE